MGRIFFFWGGAVPLKGGAGSAFNTVLPGPRPTVVPSGILIHPAVCPQQIWAENLELCLLFGQGSWAPSSTMWPGPRPTSIPSGIYLDPRSPLARIDMGRKLGALHPFGEGELGPHLTQCRLVKAYLPTKWHLDPSSHLATTDMGRTFGSCAPLGEGGFGPHLIQYGQGQGLPACQVSS